MRVNHPPDYPSVECIHATVIQKETGGNVWETIYYVVPVDYITSVRIGYAEKGARFLEPDKQMFVPFDKPAPPKNMGADKVKERLGEFGVIP